VDVVVADQAGPEPDRDWPRAFLGFQVGQAAAMGVVVVVATIIIATFALRLIFTSFSGTEQAA
jgi:sorbitol/mannitol transport system permease protein